MYLFTLCKVSRFFERFLDNNLTVLAAELQDRYTKIEQAKIEGVSPVGPNEHWKSSNSVSTMKWRQYNVFQFHSTGIYNLYSAIRSMTIEACDYYGLDCMARRIQSHCDYFGHGYFGLGDRVA